MQDPEMQIQLFTDDKIIKANNPSMQGGTTGGEEGDDL